MSLYEVLKASKTNRFPDYWTLLWGRKLSASMIKTLTGTLPLTFTAKAGNVADWTISGNDNVGKNLADFMAGEPAQGVTIDEFDAQTGSMVISCATRYRGVTITYDFQDGKTYTVSAYNNIAITGGRIALRVVGQNTIIYSSTLTSAGQKSITFTYSATDYPSGLYISLIPNMSDDGETHTISLSSLMLTEGSTAPSDFEPYQQGVGERTKNQLEITLQSGSKTSGENVLYYVVDKNVGIVTFDGTSATSGNTILEVGRVTNYTENDLRCYLSGGADGGADGGANNKYYAYAIDDDTGARPKQWDGTTTSGDSISSDDMAEVLIPAGHTIRYQINFRAMQTVTNCVFKPMLRLDGTSDTFIPYGYEIPLTMKNTSDLDRKNSTIGFLKGNGDINTEETDHITTDFIPVPANTHLKFTQRKTTSYDIRARLNVYNADKTLRRSYWEGQDFQWDRWAFEIDVTQAGYYRFSLDSSLLSSVETTTTYTIPIDAPLTEGQSISNTVEITAYKGTNTLDTSLYNKPSMTIKYK